MKTEGAAPEFHSEVNFIALNFLHPENNKCNYFSSLTWGKGSEFCAIFLHGQWLNIKFGHLN
jgi:hypothetical protein